MGIPKKVICVNALQLFLQIDIFFAELLVFRFDLFIFHPRLVRNRMALEPKFIILFFFEAPVDVLHFQAVIIWRQILPYLNRFLNNEGTQVTHMRGKELPE